MSEQRDQDVSPQLARARTASQRLRQQIAAEFGALTEAEATDLRCAPPVALRSPDLTFPAFQFDVGAQTVLPVIGPLLELAHANNWSDQDTIVWLVGPNTSFDDERPVDHLDEAAAVLAAAKNAFEVQW